MSPITTIVVALISALIGTGAGGFIVAWRKDSRQVPIDEAAARRAKLDVTDLIEKLSARTVARAVAQLEEQERESDRKLKEMQAVAELHMHEQDERHGAEITKLHRRVTQLEQSMRDGGLTVPPWE